MKKQSFLPATTAAIFLLIVISTCGFIAHDDGVIDTRLLRAEPARQSPQFNLPPASDAGVNRVPDATARVQCRLSPVDGDDNRISRDATKVPLHTTLPAFLSELPVPPFGVWEYLPDLTTNITGRGSSDLELLIGEAFAALAVDQEHFRKQLNHLMSRIEGPSDEDSGFAADVPTTSFDGDGVAGSASGWSMNADANASLP